jgi:hypothetical protein
MKYLLKVLKNQKPYIKSEKIFLYMAFDLLNYTNIGFKQLIK